MPNLRDKGVNIPTHPRKLAKILPYSPQMNRIEDEWLHLKRDALAGQFFKDEYELAVSEAMPKAYPYY